MRGVNFFITMYHLLLYTSVDLCETLTCSSGSSLSRFGKEVGVLHNLQSPSILGQHIGLRVLAVDSEPLMFPGSAHQNFPILCSALFPNRWQIFNFISQSEKKYCKDCVNKFLFSTNSLSQRCWLPRAGSDPRYLSRKITYRKDGQLLTAWAEVTPGNVFSVAASDDSGHLALLPGIQVGCST